MGACDTWEENTDVLKHVDTTNKEVLLVLKYTQVDNSSRPDEVYSSTLWEVRKEIAEVSGRDHYIFVKHG